MVFIELLRSLNMMLRHDLSPEHLHHHVPPSRPH